MQGYKYTDERIIADQHLWTRIINGDKAALGDLFDVYSKELLSYGYRISANSSLTGDAVQDVFVNLWVYRAKLSSQVQVKFYLYRAVRREVVRQLSRHEISLSSVSESEDFADPQPSVEIEWLANDSEQDMKSRIARCFGYLSPREKEIVSLKYYSDLKLKDIAALLDIKEQTVANTLQNALSKLRKHLVHLILLFCTFFNI
jgi:RNA polymerase sigma factor (sigma-70 family)